MSGRDREREPSPPPRHGDPLPVLLLGHLLGSLAFYVFLEKPIGRALETRLGVPRDYSHAAVLVFCLAIVCLGVIVQMRTYARMHTAHVPRVKILVTIGMIAVFASLLALRDPDLPTRVYARLLLGLTPINEAAEAQDVNASLAEIVAHRRSATAYFRNADAVRGLTYSFFITGRTATLKQSGEVYWESSRHRSGSSPFYYVCCSDATSQELAHFGSQTRCFRVEEDGASVACAPDVGVLSDEPLTLVYNFPSLLPPGGSANSSQSVKYVIETCWPGALWRVVDLLVVDPSGFREVRGRVRVNVFTKMGEVERVEVFRIDLASGRLFDLEITPTALRIEDPTFVGVLAPSERSQFSEGRGFELDWGERGFIYAIKVVRAPSRRT